MLKRLKKHSHLLHKTGMVLSFLCLIHCLSMPIILTALPFLAKGYISHTTEIILVGGSLIIAIFLLQKDYKVHHKSAPFILLFSAVISQGIGFFIVNEQQETMFVIIGSLLMASAYLLNWNLHQKTCSNHVH